MKLWYGEVPTLIGGPRRGERLLIRQEKVTFWRRSGYRGEPTFIDLDNGAFSEGMPEDVYLYQSVLVGTEDVAMKIGGWLHTSIVEEGNATNLLMEAWMRYNEKSGAGMRRLEDRSNRDTIDNRIE